MDQQSSFQWHDCYTSTIRGTDVLFQTQLEREAYDIINDRLLLGDSPKIFRTSTIAEFKEDFVFDAQGTLRSYKLNDVEALRTIPPMYSTEGMGSNTAARATQKSRGSSPSSLTDVSHTDSSRESSPTFTSTAPTSIGSSPISSPSLSPVPGRSVSSASSKNLKRKRGSDNEDDESKPSEKRPNKMGQQKGQKKGQPRSQKKAPREPPKQVLTTGFRARCLHKKCSGVDKLYDAPKDRDRHMDTHFDPRFACPACKKRYTRPESVQRHGLEEGGDPKCKAACEGKKYKDFEIHEPYWHEAEGWKNMYFPVRHDPLYEKAAAVLGYHL